MTIFKKIGYKIAKLIDNFIVIPLTKLIVKITGNKNKNGKFFESILSKPTSLLFISLFLSVTIFIAVDQKIIRFADSGAEVFKGQTVNAIYNEEAYVVEGLPETVDVTLIGSKADLYIAKQSSNHSVSVDLTGLGPGTHKVNIEYDQGLKGIEYSVNPSVATVIIYEKVSDSRTLTYDILNEDKLDNKYVIDNVKLNIDEVTIRGPQYKIDEVATVKALIDVSDLPSVEVGKQTIENVKLKAYDKSGNVVDVEIVPETVTATVNIESYSGTAKLKVIPKNIDKIAFGKAISSITTSVNTVNIYGEQDIVNKYGESYIPIEVDVAGLTESKTYNIVVPKPDGIREVSEKTITVKISLGKEESMEVDDIKIDAINLGPNLKAGAIGENSSKTTVIIKGTKEVLDTIDSTTIKATVDLSGLGEGEHTVNVKVSGEEVKANYFAKTTKIKVRITKS